MSIVTTTSHDGAVETWTLTRPAARNAVDFAMWETLRDNCYAARANTAIRAVVIRGAQGQFSAGADIQGLGRALAADTDTVPYRTVNQAAEHALASLPFPTVALIEGNCIGGGVQIAAACDFRLATHDATFGVTPARLGIAYPAGALERLRILIGDAHVRDLVLTARLIDAADAVRIGLIHRSVDDLEGSARDLLASLLAQSSFTQYATKEVLGALRDGRDATALGKQLESASLMHPDLAEGLRAFAEKRRPHFGARQEPDGFAL